jgi:hypothetical protein
VICGYQDQDEVRGHRRRSISTRNDEREFIEMPEDRRDVIITKDRDTSTNSLAIILGAIIVAAALAYGFWFLTTQDQGGETPTEITIQIDPGGGQSDG